MKKVCVNCKEPVVACEDCGEACCGCTRCDACGAYHCTCWQCETCGAYACHCDGSLCDCPAPPFPVADDDKDPDCECGYCRGGDYVPALWLLYLYQLNRGHVIKEAADVGGLLPEIQTAFKFRRQPMDVIFRAVMEEWDMDKIITVLY